MGAITTLIEITQRLDSLDKDKTIYASTPWGLNSKVMVFHEPESSSLPAKAEELGIKYFLEVFIAQDFVTSWEASLSKKPTLKEKCLRLIQYATNDA